MVKVDSQTFLQLLQIFSSTTFLCSVTLGLLQSILEVLVRLSCAILDHIHKAGELLRTPSSQLSLALK